MKPAQSTQKLNEYLLLSLVRGERCVLRVPGFTGPNIRQRLLTYARQSSLDRYRVIVNSESGQTVRDLGVLRVGTPYNLTYSGGSLDDYYVRAAVMRQALRDACAPDPDPICCLLHELNRFWPSGAALATFDGQEMNAGIIRVVRAEDSAVGASQPHFDCLPPFICPLIHQFAACIYLDTPTHGGELEIWDVPSKSAAEISEIDFRTDLRGMLPPSTFVPVANGDLIVFNSRRPHCVRPFAEGARISLHTFIGLTKLGQLVLWS